MTTVNTLRRALGLTCLGLLLIQVMGCNKMLAKYNLNSATKRKDESVTKNAEELTAKLLQDTKNLISKGQDELNRDDSKSAAATAKEAANLSKELLERTTEARAGQLRKDANYWIKIADLNQAQAINNQKITEYKTNNDNGEKYYNKQSYDNAIKIYAQVVEDIKFLLNDLLNDSKRKLEDTKVMKVDLEKEGAKTYAPAFVNQMDKHIADIISFIDKDRDYRKALSTYDLARQTKDAGITQTKEAKSREQMVAIEALLKTATDLGADMYALQNFMSVSKEFNGLWQRFYEKNYDLVLKQTPVLNPKAQALIIETKRESARAKARELEIAINKLVDGKARSYLPSRVEALEMHLKDANDKFKVAQADEANQSTQYDESKKVSERGLELNQTILGEFNSLAEQEIKKSTDVLATGEDVYRTMQDIFDKKITYKLAVEDQRLEDAKQAMKEELRARLANARISLELASVKRQEKDFRLAIEISKDVAKIADDVHQQTYRVVAHNAILEIANSLSRLEREGGRQYAAAETDKTLKMVEEAKTLLHGGKFREAVKQAADSKAQLAILNQELVRVAVRKIDDATKSLQSAKTNKAEQYQSDSFNQASVDLDRVKAAMEGEGVKQAIELAEHAKTLADDASQKSQKQWAQEEMKRADDLLAKARAAGAAKYAAEKLDKANAMRANLQTLFDQSSYKQAIEVGEQSVEAANAAFYAKVIEAETEIATAKRYDGWEQEHQRLANAEIGAMTARELMDAGKYEQALQNAQTAAFEAQVVSKNAKRKSFETRMTSLQKHLDTAQREGAGYYQSKDLNKILSDINRLHNEFGKTSYEDLTQGVEKLESKLASVMEMTPDVLKDLVGTMQTRMAELEKRHAKALVGPDKLEEVARKVKFAQVDFKSEKYRSSFQNARDASKLMDAIQVNLDERDFDHALHLQLKAYDKQLEKFNAVLGMGSPAVIWMATGPQGRALAVSIMNAQSPSDLLTNLNEIGARVRDLQAPHTRQDIKEAALAMLAQSKTAAQNFEKLLILDQYPLKAAREIIETAFLQMHQARTQQQQIEHALKYPQAELEPRGVERVVTYHGE